MANIIGEPLSSYVYNQIKTRQKIHGSGVDSLRTPEQLVYLNSKNAWVKMASGVRVKPERLAAEKDASNNSINSKYDWDELAKEFILYSGISRKVGTTLQPRGTSNKTNINNIYDWYEGTYNVNPFASSNSVTGEFGLNPMPGIESVDVQCINRGSTKKVTVKLTCFTPEQFKVIDLLYLRIGYTMFIEWGWAPYLEDSATLVSDYATLIERGDTGFFDYSYWKSKSYIQFSKKIEKLRAKHRGNYDGLLCKVTNFNWTFNQDGAYEINIDLISLGDVIESLKTNVSPSYKFLKDINATYKLFSDEYDSEQSQDTLPSPINNIISAYFFIQKLITYNNRETNKYWVERQIPCRIQDEAIKLCSIFVQDPNNPPSTLVTTDTEHFYIESNIQPWLDTNFPGAVKVNDLDTFESKDTAGVYYYIEEEGLLIKDYWVHVKSIIDPTDLNTENQTKKDIIYFNYNSQQGDEDVINDEGFYIRFGHLLDFVKEHVIPKIDGTSHTQGNAPVLDIDSGQWSNKMYTFPYQVSLDPRVCIVHTKEKINSKEYYTSLPVWKKEDAKAAYPMNIYLSFSKINEIISSNVDDKGNLALFDFISSICAEVNKALGGLNNLEPVIDEVTNTLKIVDGSYFEPPSIDYALELYGYNQNNPAQKGTTVSNFVRNFSIKTEITNDFATMATVGSTAGGYVKGTENTMFSKWNRGLIDRFKEKLIPADKDSREQTDGRDDPNAAYYNEFWTQRYNAFGLTAPLDVEDDIWTGDQPALSPEIIEKNLSIVTEFYKYCQSKLQELDEKYASPANGFVPISLSLTLDGISGIKIYNALNVVTRILPSNYPDSLRFIVKGVNHKISDNDWETSIETVVIANSDSDNTAEYKPNTTFVTNEISSGNNTQNDNSSNNSSNDNSSNKSTQSTSTTANNNTNSSDTSYKYEGKLPQKVSGTFKGDNGDKTHAFQSTNGVVVGGMQTKINKVLNEIYNKGINPDITNIKVTIDLKKKETHWEATLDKSKDGKAYVGLVTVGSCQSNDPFKRAQAQVNKALTWNGSPSNHALITDMKTTPDGQSNGNITIKGGKYILRQFFYKYTKNNKPPRK